MRKLNVRSRLILFITGTGGLCYFLLFSEFGPSHLWRGSIALIPLQVIALGYVAWYGSQKQNRKMTK